MQLTSFEFMTHRSFLVRIIFCLCWKFDEANFLFVHFFFAENKLSFLFVRLICGIRSEIK